MKLDELKRLAEAATPGPWKRDYQIPFGIGGAVCSSRSIVDENQKEIVLQPHMNREMMKLGLVDKAFADGSFIAAASPSVVLSLITKLEKCKAALEFYSNDYYNDFELARDTLKELEDL